MAETKWTIRPLNPTTYLVRETDEFGEYPHIYARPILKSGVDECKEASPTDQSTHIVAILLIDTGCGTTGKDKALGGRSAKAGFLSRLWQSKPVQSSANGEDSQEILMTLHSFLSTWPVPELNNKPLNPNGELPYLIAISHCHYDHILGLTYFPTIKWSSPSTVDTSLEKSQSSISITPKVTVMASSYDRSFIEPPYPNLNEHSICKDMGFKLPDYKITYWAEDGADIHWPPPTDFEAPHEQRIRASTSRRLQGTGLITYQTPGHTADSLTVYDIQARHLFIGDTIYERESPDTKAAGEPPMPIMFDNESNVADWFTSVRGMISLVTKLNEQRSHETETLVVEMNVETKAKSAHLHLEKASIPSHSEFTWLKVHQESDGSFTEIEERETETTDDHQDGTLILVRTEDLQPQIPHTGFGACDQRSEVNEEWTNLVKLHRKKHLPRVKAGAAHVTAEADAEDLLRSALLFVDLIIEDKIPGHPIKNYYRPEIETWEWSYKNPDTGRTWGRYSVQSPLEVIEKERQRRKEARLLHLSGDDAVTQ